jgi:hypothetical protein
MTQIVSQDFTFATPQQGAILETLPWFASGVPLDGSASVVVPFLSPFAQYCNAVVVQYTPAVQAGYRITTEVTATTVNGFTLTASGGPPGQTGTFTGTATGV